MDSVLEQGKAGGWSQEKYLKALEEIITKEGEGLRSGKLKLNNAE
jgi:hypothetical protein